jgi:hypothetical protein
VEVLDRFEVWWTGSGSGRSHGWEDDDDGKEYVEDEGKVVERWKNDGLC